MHLSLCIKVMEFLQYSVTFQHLNFGTSIVLELSRFHPNVDLSMKLNVIMYDNEGASILSARRSLGICEHSAWSFSMPVAL